VEQAALTARFGVRAPAPEPISCRSSDLATEGLRFRLDRAAAPLYIDFGTCLTPSHEEHERDRAEVQVVLAVSETADRDRVAGPVESQPADGACLAGRYEADGLEG